MLQILQNFAKFQKCQLDNLVDFDKCCKMRIYLQRSAPIQPKTSEILPKIYQKLATALRVHSPSGRKSRNLPEPEREADAQFSVCAQVLASRVASPVEL